MQSVATADEQMHNCLTSAASNKYKSSTLSEQKSFRSESRNADSSHTFYYTSTLYNYIRRYIIVTDFIHISSYHYTANIN